MAKKPSHQNHILRWILFIPAAILGASIAVFAGYVISGIIHHPYGTDEYPISTGILTGELFVVSCVFIGLLVAPKRTLPVKFTLASVALCVGLLDIYSTGIIPSSPMNPLMGWRGATIAILASALASYPIEKWFKSSSTPQQ